MLTTYELCIIFLSFAQVSSMWVLHFTLLFIVTPKNLHYSTRSNNTFSKNISIHGGWCINDEKNILWVLEILIVDLFFLNQLTTLRISKFWVFFISCKSLPCTYVYGCVIGKQEEFQFIGTAFYLCIIKTKLDTMVERSKWWYWMIKNSTLAIPRIS